MTRPPAFRARLGELTLPAHWLRGRVGWRGIADAHRGAAARDGRPVIVLPGFLASDVRTATLRRMLARAGYDAHGWTLGSNLGFHADLLDRMAAHLDRVAVHRPAALVGWSLGGVFARELAKRVPDKVERVVTLGSPFSGDMRANHAWRLYEAIARHPVDRPPIATVIADKPPVPTIALWSPRDGVVAAASAQGRPGERDAAIEVDCTHMGFTIAPAALRAVLAALAMKID